MCATYKELQLRGRSCIRGPVLGCLCASDLLGVCKVDVPSTGLDTLVPTGTREQRHSNTSRHTSGKCGPPEPFDQRCLTCSMPNEPVSACSSLRADTTGRRCQARLSGCTLLYRHTYLVPRHNSQPSCCRAELARACSASGCTPGQIQGCLELVAERAHGTIICTLPWAQPKRPNSQAYALHTAGRAALFRRQP